LRKKQPIFFEILKNDKNPAKNSPFPVNKTPILSKKQPISYTNKKRKVFDF